MFLLTRASHFGIPVFWATAKIYVYIYIHLYIYKYMYASICLRIRYIFPCLFKRGIYHIVFSSRGLSQMEAMVVFVVFPLGKPNTGGVCNIFPGDENATGGDLACFLRLPRSWPGKKQRPQIWEFQAVELDSVFFHLLMHIFV